MRTCCCGVAASERARCSSVSLAPAAPGESGRTGESANARAVSKADVAPLGSRAASPSRSAVACQLPPTNSSSASVKTGCGSSGFACRRASRRSRTACSSLNTLSVVGPATMMRSSRTITFPASPPAFSESGGVPYERDCGRFNHCAPAPSFSSRRPVSISMISSASLVGTSTCVGVTAGRPRMLSVSVARGRGNRLDQWSQSLRASSE